MTALTEADLARLDLLSARTDMISVFVAPDKLAALIALARRARRMEDALRWIVEHYPNPDISHVDYRVLAAKNADAILSEPGALHGGKPQ